MLAAQRALGYLPKIGSGGQIVDCDLWSNLTESVCWNPFAPTVPIQVVPDPSNPNGPGIAQPNLPAAANNLNNNQGCGTFQTMGTNGVCTTDWTSIGIIGGGLFAMLAVGKALRIF